MVCVSAGQLVGSNQHVNTGVNDGLWSYDNEEFRPKHCSSASYRPQEKDGLKSICALLSDSKGP